ncbi:MAG: TlpA family protein disulfide reductase [Muribaculaceae bacterium]|nr:TlpA family protein disulfide reductase [Muribaculaceae bacterium]
MFKKIFLSAALALASFSAMAELPSVLLKDIDGKTVDTATLSNDGKPIVISFFATWCKPCNRELKAIQEQYEDWQDETGVKVIAVSIDEGSEAQKVKPFVGRKGYEFQVLLDPNHDFKRAMGVNDIPHAFVVDGNGNITWSHQGYVDGGEADVYEEVKKACK